MVWACSASTGNHYLQFTNLSEQEASSNSMVLKREPQVVPYIEQWSPCPLGTMWHTQRAVHLPQCGTSIAVRYVYHSGAHLSQCGTSTTAQYIYHSGVHLLQCGASTAEQYFYRRVVQQLQRGISTSAQHILRSISSAAQCTYCSLV